MRIWKTILFSWNQIFQISIRNCFVSRQIKSTQSSFIVTSQQTKIEQKVLRPFKRFYLYQTFGSINAQGSDRTSVLYLPWKELNWGSNWKSSIFAGLSCIKQIWIFVYPPILQICISVYPSSNPPSPNPSKSIQQIPHCPGALGNFTSDSFYFDKCWKIWAYCSYSRDKDDSSMHNVTFTLTSKLSTNLNVTMSQCQCHDVVMSQCHDALMS